MVKGPKKVTWIFFALLSSAVFGTIAIMDKRLLDKYMPSLSSYYVWIGVAVFGYGLVFLFIDGIPRDIPMLPLLVAGLSGLFWGGAMAAMFWGYKLHDVSRASALVFTFPVFVALLAVPFLGESLVLGQWLAIVVVMVGAFLISSVGSSSSGPMKLTRAFPILLGASLLTALGHLTGKYALQNDLSVGLVTSLRFLGMAAVLAFFWRPQTFSEIRQAMRHKEAVVLLIVAEIVMVPFAIFLMITATKLGPVSLVATLTGTRPIFVFFYSAILSTSRFKVLNESLERRSLAVRLASVLMIIGGIVVLGLLVDNRFACFCPY